MNGSDEEDVGLQLAGVKLSATVVRLLSDPTRHSVFEVMVQAGRHSRSLDELVFILDAPRQSVAYAVAVLLQEGVVEDGPAQPPRAEQTYVLTDLVPGELRGPLAAIKPEVLESVTSQKNVELFAFVLREGSVRVSDVSARFGCSAAQSSRRLRVLAEAGLVARRGRRPRAYRYVTTDVLRALAPALSTRTGAAGT